MTDGSETGGKRSGIPWRVLGWGGVAVLLTIPLIARFPWTLSDFIVAGAMLGGSGLVLELLVRVSPNVFYRIGAGFAVLAALGLVWVNGAVGFLGGEDNPANLMFGGVIAVAVLGSVIGGFKAGGMARAMFAAAAAQVAVGLIGLAAGWASPGGEGVKEVAVGTILFGGLWLVSGGLFRRAARTQALAA